MQQPNVESVLTVDDFRSDSVTAFPDGAAFGAGDSFLLLNILPHELASRAVRELQAMTWCTMQNRGGDVPRLVSMQATIADGCEPVYRHPADVQPETKPWAPIVDEIRRVVEQRLGQTFNHGLIQWYRTGHDWISQHSDKTLDVTRPSVIINVSVGATRVMILKSKAREPRLVQKFDLPHNSVFVLGLHTNRLFTHEIKQDKRPLSVKRADELRDAGHRISLTFRSIHTFRRAADGRLFGGGARHKTLDAVGDDVPIDDAQDMLRAFSAENRLTDFDWDAHYGGGFDSLNFSVFNAEQQRLREAEAKASIEQVGLDQHLDVGEIDDDAQDNN